MRPILSPSLLLPSLAAACLFFTAVPGRAADAPATTATSAETVPATATAAAAALPVINFKVSLPAVAGTAETPAIVVVTRSGGDLSQPLVVNYSIKGSAKNGTDYQVLAKKITLKAHKAKGKIRIQPIDSIHEHAVRSIRLKLKANAAYQAGTTTVANLSIVYSGK